MTLVTRPSVPLCYMFLERLIVYREMQKMQNQAIWPFASNVQRTVKHLSLALFVSVLSNVSYSLSVCVFLFVCWLRPSLSLTL